MQLRPESLSEHCWACLLDTWLAQRCLAAFGPTNTDLLCEQSSLLAYQQHLPCAAATAREVCTKSSRLARNAADVTVLPPVTEKQGQLQRAHIAEALQRYVSLLQVTHSLLPVN